MKKLLVIFRNDNTLNTQKRHLFFQMTTNMDWWMWQGSSKMYENFNFGFLNLIL